MASASSRWVLQLIKLIPLVARVISKSDGRLRHLSETGAGRMISEINLSRSGRNGAEMSITDFRLMPNSSSSILFS